MVQGGITQQRNNQQMANPFAHRLGSDLQDVLETVGANFRQLQRQCQQHLQPFQQAQHAVHSWWQQSPLAQQLQRQQVVAHRGPWAPMMAVSGGGLAQLLSRPSRPTPTSTALLLQSMTVAGSSSSSSSKPQALFDIAMSKEDVKARLAPIPVYTVANPKNEFVLVAGEVRWIAVGSIPPISTD